MAEETKKRKRKTKSVDMLNGPLAGKLVMFALPLAASSILQTLFNSADLAVVGRFDSSNSMAAVGSNGSVVQLLVGLFMGMSIGANVVVAQLIGRNSREEISHAVHTSIVLAAICGVASVIIGEIFAPMILQLMSVPEEVLPLAVEYLRIYFLAMPFMMIYNYGSAVLRAKGDSMGPVYVLVMSGVMNVILNLIFVIAFKMSVAGVAIATVISNAAAAVVILIMLMRDPDPDFRFSFHKLCLKKEHVIRIMAIGIPAGLQGLVFSLSNIVIQSSINSFGANAIAGNTAAQNFEFMCYMVVNAFANAATTFTSQNFAAGKVDRCKRVYKDCMLLGLSASAILGLVFYCGRGFFIQFFTVDAAVISFAMIRMLTNTTMDWMTGTYEISGGCLRGMGHSMMPTIITVVGSCVLRLIWIFTIFQLKHDFLLLLVVYPISWVVTGTAMNIAYAVVSKREFAKIQKQPAEAEVSQ